MSGLIRREDIPYVDINSDMPHSSVRVWVAFKDSIDALPSAEANSDDLIIKGAKGIQDGLYNIKDGKLFKYKAKGGTVRTYEIVPSSEVHGEWIDTEFLRLKECSCCHNRWGVYSIEEFDFCPSCGARMTPYKGGEYE